MEDSGDTIPETDRMASDILDQVFQIYIDRSINNTMFDVTCLAPRTATEGDSYIIWAALPCYGISHSAVQLELFVLSKP